MAATAGNAVTGPTSKAYNIDDLRTMARKRLPKVIFDYLDGGSDDEVTLRNNRAAFSEYSLNSRMLVNVSDVSTQTTVLGEQLDCSFDWQAAEEIRAAWDGPFIIKGLASATDAKRAADIGASAVVVSNHGGRQLDHAPSTLEVLPEVMEAVGSQLEVFVDSGFRRGTDVIKALALGARAVLIGRPYLYGLAAGGRAGVIRALQLLETELIRDMKLMGLTNINDISPDCLRQR